MDFKYCLEGKRYHTLNYDLTNRFKVRVFKVSLNGGFSCPNFKNGSGCIFCSAKGSGDFAGNKEDDLLTQFNTVKEKINKKWPDTKYIAYFQANTNTFAPVKILKEKFEQVIKFPNVVGLSIGTRPDAITSDCLDYLIDLNKRTYLTIELGLQSMHDDTLKLINRGHDLKCFDDCVKKLRKNKINVVVHIINGLPFENKEMMLNTIKHLNKLDIQGIKIHMLHILKNTKLEEFYNENKFHVLTKEEYVNIVCDQIELLDEKIVIHRLTGDAPKNELVEPVWTLKKVCVLNDIDKELKKRQTYQGFSTNILNKVNLVCEKSINSKDLVVDATGQNINNTLKLCSLSKTVFCFNNRKNIIDYDKETFKKNNIIIINDLYKNIKKDLNKYNEKISLIIFNFNQLPKSNKTLIKSIKESFKLLNNKGKILIAYYKNNKGKKAFRKILKRINKTNMNYNIYRNKNNISAQFLIEIIK